MALPWLVGGVIFYGMKKIAEEECIECGKTFVLGSDYDSAYCSNSCFHNMKERERLKKELEEERRKQREREKQEEERSKQREREKKKKEKERKRIKEEEAIKRSILAKQHQEEEKRKKEAQLKREKVFEQVLADYTTHNLDIEVKNLRKSIFKELNTHSKETFSQLNQTNYDLSSAQFNEFLKTYLKEDNNE